MYPLRFAPLFRRYLWGGRRLQTVLGKPLGEGNDYAESWEVVDRDADQSVVTHGPLAGKSLRAIMQELGNELLGQHHPQPRFPLLFKLLDAQQQLSVQVHPNDQQAAALASPDLGKTEAWYILAAEPGSYLYAGLLPGIDRPALLRELASGTLERCLHCHEPQVGECIFLPAGTVHAIGPGLLIAEIQQSSDTTYRLFDWNRLGADGKLRQLHIDQALDVIDFSRGPVVPQPHASTSFPHVRRLVACDKFILDQWRLAESQQIGGDNRCRLVCVTSGSATVEGDAAGQPLLRGETLLVPAACGALNIIPRGSTELLVASLP